MALFRRKKQAPLVTVTNDFQQVLSLLFTGDWSSAYRKIPAVRTAVDFIGQAIATTPLKVYDRAEAGRPELRDHPMAILLRRPNDDMDTYMWLAKTLHDLLVFGNAYSWKAQVGSLRQLIPLDPWRVNPQGGTILAAGRYDVSLGSEIRQLSRDEMFHVRLYNPVDQRIGVSKLESVRALLDEDQAASEHRQSFWRNAARREGVLERDVSADWSDEEIQRFREQWRGLTSGKGNAGLTAITPPGTKWVPDSFSSKDSEFIQGRRFITEAVARVYNVPPALMGLTDTATFASQRSFHTQLYTDTLPSWYQIVESALEVQVLPWVDPVPGEVYVEFLVEAKLRGDFVEQAGVVNIAVGRPWMEVAEARAKMNLPDRGDPNDNKLAIPANNVVLEGAPEVAPPNPDVIPIASRR